MTKKQADLLIVEYEEYCKNDGKRLYHLPFVIWLKHKKKITHFPYEYYK